MNYWERMILFFMFGMITSHLLFHALGLYK